jgi:hypothetical protein
MELGAVAGVNVNVDAWVVAVAVAVAVLACAVPTGRRLVVLVPVVISISAVVTFAAAGVQVLADEEEAATEAKVATHLSTCRRAVSLAEAGLVEASARQLAAATASEPETPDATATEACSRAADLVGVQRGERVLPVPDAAAPSDEEAPDVVDAVQAGVEDLVDGWLNDGQQEGDPALTMGLYGWLGIAALAVALLLVWTNTYFSLVRGTRFPSVRVSDPTSGGPATANMTTSVGAQIRQTLFRNNVEAPLATTEISEAIYTAIEKSGAPGSGFTAAVAKLAMKLFRTTNTVVAKVTLLDTNSAIVEIIDERDGATVTVERPTVTDPALLPESVAATIKVAALSRRGFRQLPPWLEWSEQSMTAFLSGESALAAAVSAGEDPP